MMGYKINYGVLFRRFARPSLMALVMLLVFWLSWEVFVIDAV